MTVVMYTKPNCPYCAAAREHLTAEGVEFQEKDATRDPFWKRELMRYSGGSGVVPTIVTTGDAEEVQVGFPPGRG